MFITRPSNENQELYETLFNTIKNYHCQIDDLSKSLELKLLQPRREISIEKFELIEMELEAKNREIEAKNLAIEGLKCAKDAINDLYKNQLSVIEMLQNYKNDLEWKETIHIDELNKKDNEIYNLNFIIKNERNLSNQRVKSLESLLNLQSRQISGSNSVSGSGSVNDNSNNIRDHHKEINSNSSFNKNNNSSDFNGGSNDHNNYKANISNSSATSSSNSNIKINNNENMIKSCDSSNDLNKNKNKNNNNNSTDINNSSITNNNNNSNNNNINNNNNNGNNINNSKKGKNNINDINANNKYNNNTNDIKNSKENVSKPVISSTKNNDPRIKNKCKRNAQTFNNDTDKSEVKKFKVTPQVQSDNNKRLNENTSKNLKSNENKVLENDEPNVTNKIKENTLKYSFSQNSNENINQNIENLKPNFNDQQGKKFEIEESKYDRFTNLKRKNEIVKVDKVNEIENQARKNGKSINGLLEGDNNKVNDDLIMPTLGCLEKEKSSSNKLDILGRVGENKKPKIDILDRISDKETRNENQSTIPMNILDRVNDRNSSIDNEPSTSYILPGNRRSNVDLLERFDMMSSSSSFTDSEKSYLRSSFRKLRIKSSIGNSLTKFTLFKVIDVLSNFLRSDKQYKYIKCYNFSSLSVQNLSKDRHISTTPKEFVQCLKDQYYNLFEFEVYNICHNKDVKDIRRLFEEGQYLR